MKQPLSFVILVVFVGLSAFANDEQHVNATLTNATIFLNRAQLTATAKVILNAGTTEVIIDNIPANTDPQSVQVKGKGDATIMGVQFGRNFLKNSSKSQNIQRVEDSLRNAKNDLKVIEMNYSVAENEKALILSNKSVGGAQTGVKVADVKEMANFYRERLTEIGTKLIQLEQKILLQKEKIERLQNQLNQQNVLQNRPSGQIKITLLASARTNAELEVSYLIYEANWSPVYDLRAKDAKSPIRLSYKARVYQNTGMDWEKVRITLSTANPALGGTAPQLSTKYVDFFEPEPERVKYSVRKTMAAPSGTYAEAAEVVAAPAMQDMATTASYTQVVDAPISVNFEIAQPYTLPSGGEPQTVDVLTAELPASLTYQAIPKLDTDAFLVAKVSGWEKYSLLNGPANLYFEGTYVGQSQLNITNPNDTLTLSLGRDKKVLVKREQLNEFTTRKALGSQIKESFSYRITVRNNKNEVIKIHLEDQIPVSRNSQIEVDLFDNHRGQYNAENGKLVWDLQLNPNESRVIELQYSIKYPKGKTITAP
jgi:uncharacterized protein (TIGR02231 family)